MPGDLPVQIQVSAGGVTYRRDEGRIDVVLISVGSEKRWQLPKGLVEPGEDTRQTAQREVREETGLNAELLEPLETIEYWYSAVRHGKRTRYHKFVHFFLLEYREGQLSDHDHEVNEARWFEIGEALERLSFENEKRVVRMALDMIHPQPAGDTAEETA